MAFRQNLGPSGRFEDFFIIDDERGLAVIESIRVKNSSSSSSRTKNLQHLSVTEDDSNFLYELKFFLQTEKCFNDLIDEMTISVYAEMPEEKADVTSSPPLDPKAHIESILSKKQENSSSNNAVSDKFSKNLPIMTETFKVGIGGISSSEKKLNKTLLPPRINLTRGNNIRNKSRLSGLKNFNYDASNDTASKESKSYKTNKSDKNVSGPSVQTYKISVDPSLLVDNKILPGNSNVSIVGTTTSGFSNSGINSILTGPAGGGNKNSARSEISDIALQTLNLNLISSHGVHPAAAAGAFFPGQPKGDSASKTPAVTASSGALKNARDPVKQDSMSTATIGATNNGARDYQIPRPDAAVKDLTKAKGGLGKNISDLCSNMVSPGFEKSGIRPTALAEFKTKFLQVFKVMSINSKMAGAREHLYFEVILHRADKKTNFKKIFVTSHYKQLAALTTPDIAPILKLSSQRSGKNSVTIAQTDPFASAVHLEKRIVNAFEDAPMPYEDVGTFSLTSRDSPLTIEITENNTGSNTALYRATAIGPFGQRASSVSSIVVKSLKLPPTVRQGSPRVNKTVSVLNSLIARNTPEGIRLMITNFPTGAIAFYIMKTELGTQFSIDGKNGPLQLEDGGHIRMLSGLQKSSIEILDRKVYDGRTYCYKCVFKLPNSKKVFGNSTEIIKYLRNIRQLPTDININNTIVDENYNSLSAEVDSSDLTLISFEIETVPTKTGIEEIVQLLVDAKVNDVFIEDLKKDRNRLSSFAFYEVIRTNLINGKKESFGITSGGVFKDSPEIRKKLGISPIKPGDKFSYAVNLFLKSPESLFKSATTQVAGSSSSALINEQLTRALSQKFALKYTKSDSLPSEQELLDKSPNSLRKQIERGATGYSKSIDIKLPKRKIGIENLTCAASKLGHNEINWVITGEKKLVDHCIIFATFNGKTQPIGVVSPSTKNIETFFDKKFCGLVGTVTYQVELVLLDFSKVKSNLSATITRQQTMPQELIDRLTADNVDIVSINLSAKNAQSDFSTREFTGARPAGENTNVNRPPRVRT